MERNASNGRCNPQEGEGKTVVVGGTQRDEKYGEE